MLAAELRKVCRPASGAFLFCSASYGQFALHGVSPNPVQNGAHPGHRLAGKLCRYHLRFADAIAAQRRSSEHKQVCSTEGAESSRAIIGGYDCRLSLDLRNAIAATGWGNVVLSVLVLVRESEIGVLNHANTIQGASRRRNLHDAI
jgi:hypothetical protein